MGFRNSILAGLTLIREAIRSPNYEPGQAGWSINADGSAEFSNVTLRGVGEAGDEFMIVVGPEGRPQVMVGSNAFQGFVQFPTNRPIEGAVSTILSSVVDADLPSESASLQIQGPSLDTEPDRMSLLLTSRPADGLDVASFSVVVNGTTPVLYISEVAAQFYGPGLGFFPDASGSTAMQLQAAAGQTGSLLIIARGGNTKFQIPSDGRVIISPDAGSTSGLLVDGAAGHTGYLQRWRTNIQDMATLSAQGSFWARNLQCGQAVAPAPGASPGQTTVNVTFAVPFPATPRIVLTPVSASANINSANIRWSTMNISTTGFTVQCWRDTNFSTTFDWHAYSA